MESRKIIGFGKSSLVMSLPKKWLEQNGLGKGEEIFIRESDDGLLLSNKKSDDKKVEKKCVVDVDNLTMLALKRKISAEYINNSNFIELRGKKIVDISHEIKTFLRDFMVLEIIEETDDLIVAKDYLNLETMTKEGIVDRLYNILKSMFKDLQEEITPEIYESLMSRERQVNKYYFLMERFVRYQLQKIDSNEIKSNLIDFSQVSIYLENVGDGIKKLVTLIRESELEVNDDMLKFLKECEKYFISNMEVFLAKDKSAFLQIADSREDLLNSVRNFDISDKAKERFTQIIKNIHKAARYTLSIV